MTGRDIIQYISHFDLDTPIQFLDDEGYLHDVTDYSDDNYLGNGKYNERPKSIVFQTVGKKYKNKELRMTNRIYFISGHRDITQEEFDKYYLEILDKVAEDASATFVVGDYEGVDFMAQQALAEMVSPNRVTVYHMFDKPRHLASDKFNLKGGYKNDIDRDSAMTRESTDDIAWIRKGKETSGTAQNILRRYTFM